ncbi:hypothetical protein [Pseudonocardia sp.]|uniref:hypothetical protein n=1 Tax=Pseudonocardia sp. TaxID=60912 RepID=UPI003D120AF0
MPRSRLLVAFALVAGLGLAGCGGTSAPAGAPDVTPAPMTNLPPLPTSDPTDLQSLVLRPDEVGPGFASATWSPPGASDTLPCGQPSLAAAFKAVPVGGAFAAGDAIRAQESIDVFTDAATAAAAFDALTAGYGCGESSEGRIGPAFDVTEEIGADRATLWSVDRDGDRINVVGVLGRGSVLTVLVSATETAAADAPDPTDVARAAYAKLAAS